jgi:seryl-tRNA synthetase
MYKNRPPSVVYLFFKKRYVSGVAVIYNTTTHFENTALGSVITFRGMGKGFPVYKNNSYSFIRYLVDFFISESLKHGFTEVSLPVLVKAGQVFRTGQLPDKEGQMFMVGKDNLYLLPTAEVSVTNLLNNKKLHLSDLPILYSSYSLCFRREIGGWGRLNKGLNRVHQFDKVELVKVVDYLNSNEGLILLSNNVIALLDKLNITYRVISIRGPDLSFSGSKQLDIEV